MISKINAFLSSIVATILSMLPNSPFSSVIDTVADAEWLGYINYFIPIGTLVGIATTWGVAIGVFYVYQMILRWAKAIGD
ncbi:MAG: hypothetical protein RR313_11795 [Anaerovoracaceae bacterium]